MPRVERRSCQKCRTLIKLHQPNIKCVNCNCLYHRRCASNLNRHNKHSWKCISCINEHDSVPPPHIDNNELQNEMINNPISRGIQNPSSLDPNALNELFDSHSDTAAQHNDDDVYIDLHDEIYAVSDDIESYCEQYYLIPNNHFNLLSLNARSLQNTKNYSKLEALLLSLSIKPSIIGVSETWVTPNSSGPYNNLDSYEFISNHRLVRAGGGVGFYVAKGIKPIVNTELSVMHEGFIESLFLEILINKKRTYIGVIYRAGSEKDTEAEVAHTIFLQTLRDILGKATRFGRQCIIMGDFNYNMLDLSNRYVNDYKDLMFEHSFYSLINRPTRITTSSATCLDHIWTNIYQNDYKSLILCDLIADHLPTMIVSSWGKPTIEENQNQDRLSDKELLILNKKLENCNLDGIENSNINVYLENLLKKIDECTTEIISSRKQTHYPKKKHKKWYDHELRKLKNKRERLYKVFLSTRDAQSKHAYDYQNQIYVNKLLEKKNEFSTSLFEKYKGNIKATWSMINRLLGKSKQQICQSLKIKNTLETDPKILVEEFNRYFSNIAETIKAKLPQPRKNYRSYLPRYPSMRSVYFWPTDPQEVKDLTMSSKSKNSTGLDRISSKKLKHMPDKIFFHLSEIFNMSLSQGKFIDSFKIAKVVPIFKDGSRTDIGNYRPISLVSNIGKILEKIVNKRILKFLHKTNFFFKNQFGFRKNRSTEQATSLLSNMITKSLENNNYVLNIFCDMSKAFDCIEIPILLDKLNHYGVRGIPLAWIEDYLSGRSQKVQLGNVLSETICFLNHGTAQGSILGPLLFLIYINDLPNCLDNSEAILFADDTTLVSEHSNHDTLIAIGSEELASLYDWLCANKLSLNLGKTKSIVFRTSRRHLRGPLNVLSLNGNKIDMVDNHIFLGVNFNKNLSWANQMLRTKSKLRANVGVISKIRYQITPPVVINLFQAMVLSHLRYCNITWCYGNFTIRTTLQAQSNKFLRAGFRLHYRTSVKYLMDIYKLPSLNEISFKSLACTMHKISLNIYPSQFSTFFVRAQQRYATSSSEMFRFLPTFHKFETTKQALSHRACKTWGSIPMNIKYDTISSSNNYSDIEYTLQPIKVFTRRLDEYIRSVIIITPLF